MNDRRSQQRRQPSEPLPEEFDVQDAPAMMASSPGPEQEAIGADTRKALVGLVPGTKMFFKIDDAQSRADIIAYLAELK